MRKSLVAVWAIALAVGLIATAGAGATTTGAAGTQTFQMSQASNFECGPEPNEETLQNDSLVQYCETSGENARCVEKSSSPAVTQTCIITQDETDNDAYILQDNSTGASSTQTQSATQIAMVTQQGTTNRLDATQSVNQSLSGSGALSLLTQNQDDEQKITVCQGESADCATPNSGGNVSKIHQSRFASEHASGGNIVQNQDQNTPVDCDTFNQPTHPNLCALVNQSSTATNDSDLHQENHLQEVATGTATSVEQNQGQISGGIDGHVSQLLDTAQNSSVVHQHQTDDASGPAIANQRQDPGLGCCSNGGHVNGHQVGVLRASDPAAHQHLTIDGFCSVSNNCLLLAHGKINGGEATDRCQTEQGTEDECITFVECDEGEGCTTVPIDIDLASLGFDTMDFRDAINFVFPLALPTSPL